MLLSTDSTLENSLELTLQVTINNDECKYCILCRYRMTNYLYYWKLKLTANSYTHSSVRAQITAVPKQYFLKIDKIRQHFVLNHYLFLQTILVTTQLTAVATSFTTEIDVSENPPYKNDSLLLQKSPVIFTTSKENLWEPQNGVQL